jgi:adenine-specific DNA-methyltransferase
MPRTNQLLQLTWFNKDKALIPTEHGKYGYSWVDARDPRYCETHTLVEGEYIEGVQAEKEDDLSYSKLADLEPTTDNLLINGESGNVLEALTRVPELADKYLGKIKLCYIDPPFNTAEAFTHADYEDNLEHSVWLTMMRDRLVHIKKLLTDAGSIWVHLDVRGTDVSYAMPAVSGGRSSSAC